jgi:hypothetical protein
VKGEDLTMMVIAICLFLGFTSYYLTEKVLEYRLKAKAISLGSLLCCRCCGCHNPQDEDE